VEAKPEDIPILRRLMQLYLYDLGTLYGWDQHPAGTFSNATRIERFWSGEPGRRSFVIRVGGSLGGFALTRRGSHVSGDEAQEISEFFVLRKAAATASAGSWPVACSSVPSPGPAGPARP